MTVIKTLEVHSRGGSEQRLWGCRIDSPVVGERTKPYALGIAGWALGRTLPVTGVEIVSENTVLRRVPLDVPRPDIAAAFSEVPDAERSGFRTTIGLLDGAQHFEYQVRAVLRDDSRIVVGTIRGQRESLQSDFEIADVSSITVDLSEPLWGCHIDFPYAGAQSDTYALGIAGWALGRTLPVTGVEIVSENTVLRRVPLDVPRPDIAAAFSEVPDAERSGFRTTIGLLDGAQHFEYQVRAVLRDDSRIVVGTIRGQRESLQSDFEIADVSSITVDLSEPLWGCHIDFPYAGAQSDTYALGIAGWALGRTLPVTGVEIVSENTVLRRVPLDVPRPDIAAAFSEVPDAERSGFRTTIGLLDGAQHFEYQVRAVLRDDSRIVVGTIRGQRESLQSDFEIADVSSITVDLSEPLWGCHIDFPYAGAQSDTYALGIAGWALGRTLPVTGVEIVSENTVLRRVPLDVPRPDIAAAFSEVPDAERSGFRTTIGLLDGAQHFEYQVRAVLRDDSRIVVGTIRGQRESLQSDFEIADVSSITVDLSEPLWGCHIDFPYAGAQSDTYALGIAGWALGRTLPVTGVEIVSENTVLRRVPLDVPRPDIAAAFSEVPD